VSVRRFLVTAPDQVRMAVWVRTAAYANWLEGRPNRHQSETWLVTVFGEHAEHFLDSARVLSATVEEVEGAGDDERYVLLIGESGTSWTAGGEGRGGVA
jgi:hypothetical protein